MSKKATSGKIAKLAPKRKRDNEQAEASEKSEKVVKKSRETQSKMGCLSSKAEKKAIKEKKEIQKRVAEWVKSTSPDHVEEIIPKSKPSKDEKSQLQNEAEMKILEEKYGRSPWSDYQLLASLENLPENRAKTIINLFEEDNTIPFLVRYRRDLIGLDMTAEKLRDVKNTYNHIVNIKNKAQSVINKLKSKEQLTPHIEFELRCAQTMDEVDHLYEPYKERKGSLYEKALSLGLGDVSEGILYGKHPMIDPINYVNGTVDGLETVKKVEDAIKNVIVHNICKNAEVLEKLRELQHRYRITLTSNVVKKKTAESSKRKETTDNKKENKKPAESQEHKFQNYFDFSCTTNYIKPHQVLAINRGEKLGILSVKIRPDDNIKRDLYYCVENLYMNQGARYPFRTTIFEAAFEEAYSKKLLPLMQRQIRSNLTSDATVQSIKVFASNLKQLLLMAPVKGEKILGIDPGFSNGCKMAIISECGDVLDTFTLYPHTKSGKQDITCGETMAEKMEKHNCTLIALGNGTACRETEKWLSELMYLNILDNSRVRYSIVSEQGASIYSCSDTAKKEFGEMDVNLISAVSIARRLNDPLCELVKVDAKNIGVGMYQHDISEKMLTETLNEVVIECVSFTGVDINTASVALLKHVAGLTEKRADQIIKYRIKNGPFKCRDDIQKVTLIGPKTFVQCAGFVRIEPLTAGITDRNYNVLDSTTVHPESYDLAKTIIKDCLLKLDDIGSSHFIEKVKSYQASLDEETCMKKYKVPYERVTAVLESLQKEPLRDYRLDVNNKPLFKSGLTKMSDLTVNGVVSGAVTNICDFGAFVDIGVECNGLIHSSKMNGQKVKIGDKVEATVLSIDSNRNRIGLALKTVLC